MHLASASVFLLLASLMTSCTSGTSRTSGTSSLEGRDGNSSAADAGFVPLAATKVHQLIAREGSCVLIDCNVSGEPLPSFQWFNSHGERLDTESEGEAGRSGSFKPPFLLSASPAEFNQLQNQKVRLADRNTADLCRGSGFKNHFICYKSGEKLHAEMEGFFLPCG